MTALGVALFVGFLVFVIVLRVGVEVCRGYDEGFRR